jgi:hypothetical protein
MATITHEGVQSNSQPERNNGPAVIRSDPLGQGPKPQSQALLLTVVWISSFILHVILLLLFAFVTVSSTNANVSTESQALNADVDEEKPQEKILTSEDEGTGVDPSEGIGYDVPRIESISIPGPVNPTENIGMKDAEGPQTSVPPPPGIGDGLGGTNLVEKGGLAALNNMPGGLHGIYAPGGPGGRSGSTKDDLLKSGGGTTGSELAVGRGLGWIARHQAPDGHWGLDSFDQHGKCKCTGLGLHDDIAGTAFGVLPFLGAGETHIKKKDSKSTKNYHLVVDKALKYLMSKQARDGGFGGTMYSHGLATIAMCEAYGMTGDKKLRDSAQRAINFVRAAQSENGGWRYEPRQGGDTSVVGWQVMALRSGQMAELTVEDKNNMTLGKATKWLNSCNTADGGGYGYTGPEPTPTMTAVGLLCRLYLGTGPRNSGIQNGVKYLMASPPGSTSSMYYYYYATQVMHHVGGPAWEGWNPKMRDMLIAKQDQGTDAKHKDQLGSWSPAGDVHAGAGGRLMITSMSIMTLEVYYRHLPLYQKDAASGKGMAAK